MWMGVLPICMPVYYMGAQCLQNLEKGIGSYETGVMSHHVMLGIDLSLEEQSIIFTAKSLRSLQAPLKHSCHEACDLPPDLKARMVVSSYLH